MTITLPKSFILFVPAIRRGGYSQQLETVRKDQGPYHLAVSFKADGAVSLCNKATVDKFNGYWMLISLDELVQYNEEMTPLICKKCLEVLL